MASKDARYFLPSLPRVYLIVAREKIGISGEALSRELDVSKSYYYAIENGTRGYKMTVMMLAKIMECLNLDANFLVSEEVKYHNERQAYISSKKKRR